MASTTVTFPKTPSPSAPVEWVNLNLRLVRVGAQNTAPRQAAVRQALQTSTFASVIRSCGWHIADDTLE